MISNASVLILGRGSDSFTSFKPATDTPAGQFNHLTEASEDQQIEFNNHSVSSNCSPVSLLMLVTNRETILEFSCPVSDIGDSISRAGSVETAIQSIDCRILPTGGKRCGWINTATE